MTVILAIFQDFEHSADNALSVKLDYTPTSSIGLLPATPVAVKQIVGIGNQRRVLLQQYDKITMMRQFSDADHREDQL